MTDLELAGIALAAFTGMVSTFVLLIAWGAHHLRCNREERIFRQQLLEAQREDEAWQSPAARVPPRFPRHQVRSHVSWSGLEMVARAKDCRR